MLIDNFRPLSVAAHAGQGSEFSLNLADRITEAIEKTRRYFMDCQYPEGYWWFELESNVTITAEYLMLLAFAGAWDKEKAAKMASHILNHQRPDGTWAIYKGGRGDASTSIEAYFALKLAGYPAEDPRLERARRFIIANGGPANARVFTKIFLALFGQYDWKEIPSVPVEIVLLPSWFPLNIYNFSSWARATFVPLSVILDAKPVRIIPQDRGTSELMPAEPEDGRREKSAKIFSWKTFFARLDNVVKATEESRVRSFRKKGLERALRWIDEHQEETGDWGGIQPAMVNSILALLVQGHDLSYPAVRKGFEALDRCIAERRDEMVLQSCISPVWDTALTALALSYSGMQESHPAMISACQWLAGKQILKKGDWSVKRPRLEPGGWAFEFVNNWYPDIDDTAVVLMLLNRCGRQRFLSRENFDRAVGWVLGMQGKDGGWGAFDVDNNVEVLNQIPFGDLEAMIDPSTPDITGRSLELLGSVNYSRSSKAVRAGLKFLKKTPGKRWPLVGQVGSQLRLWDLVGAHGPGRHRRGYGEALCQESCCRPQGVPERRRRLGGELRVVRGPQSEGAWEKHAFPDRLGSDGPYCGRRGRFQRGDRGSALPPGKAGTRRDLGRGGIYGHRFSPAFHDKIS